MATYLFDFDGTLVDSMEVYGNMMLRILDENGISYPENILKIITPLGYAGTADYFINMGITKTKDELIDYAVRSGAPLEVIENLQEIEDEGDVYESIEDIWPDYPSKEDFFFDEEEY